MTEKALEQKARKEIMKLGGLLIKLVSPGFAGAPDRIALLPVKRLYFVEFKSASGRLSKLQVVVHEMLNALGFPVYVISTDDELRDFLLSVG